jgi:hypothetical protein
MFSIGTIEVPIHTKLVFKLIHIIDFSIAKLIPKQPIEPICVLVINLTIPLDIVEQHLLETFFHPKVGKMIIDETPIQKQIQDLTIVGWIVTEDEQLTIINLGTKDNVRQVKVNFSLESFITY